MRTFGLFLIFPMALAAVSQRYKPKDGYVPDAATAIRVAEAVLTPVYGKQKIESEEPFSATRKGNVWTVEGTMHCPGGGEQCMGGVAMVQISKADGCIIAMTHGK